MIDDSDIKTFGPNSCKAHIPEPYTHRAVIPQDDGGPISFQWHFQRGILQPRMSGYELATFIIGHMPHVIPFFVGHPRVQAEFGTMLMLLATSPREVIDRIIPWIRSVTREGPDDIVHLSLFDKTEQPSGPIYFILES